MKTVNHGCSNTCHHLFLSFLQVTEDIEYKRDILWKITDNWKKKQVRDKLIKEEWMNILRTPFKKDLT